LRGSREHRSDAALALGIAGIVLAYFTRKAPAPVECASAGQ